MCGLTAIYSYGNNAPPVDRQQLLRINNAMAARGPDGEGVWVSHDGKIGFGHRRLAIIDPGPGGAQPMALNNENGQVRLSITYNGEIYNFRELRRELLDEGRRLKTHSDTEVLLYLYDRDGPGMVHRLRGMFAFAIWDAKKNGLFLARDPYGIKPLYYADTGRSLFVASQVKALSSGGAEIGGVNPAGHVGFFLLGYVPEPHTLHAAVKALPAGTSLWCDSNGQRKINKYFDLSEKLAQKTPDLSRQETQEVLASSLRDSMRHHLVADVPVGVFLSAGLDSATVAALATERSGASLESMTLRFDEFAGDQKDEAPLAEEIARLYGTRHQIRTVKGSDFKRDFEKLTAAMDQPSVDGVNTYFVAKEAAAMGLKVALSGVGGDELFGGYNTFHQVPTLVKSLGWIPGISGIGATLRIISAPLIAQFTSPKYASLLEYSGDYAAAYFLRRGLFMPWELPDILDPEMVREGWRELNMLEDMAAATCRIDTDRHKVAALENQWYLRNQLLRDADWAGMAHSLEIRTPLVDAELFATVGRLAVGKQDMAATPKKALPNAVLNRPKTGFYIPVREWLLGNQPPGSRSERGVRGWAKIVYENALKA